MYFYFLLIQEWIKFRYFKQNYLIFKTAIYDLLYLHNYIFFNCTITNIDKRCIFVRNLYIYHKIFHIFNLLLMLM